MNQKIKTAMAGNGTETKSMPLPFSMKSKKMTVHERHGIIYVDIKNNTGVKNSRK